MKKKRDIFGEIMSGVDSMKPQRDGKITLKNYKLAATDLPEIDSTTCGGPLAEYIFGGLDGRPK